MCQSIDSLFFSSFCRTLSLPRFLFLSLSSIIKPVFPINLRDFSGGIPFVVRARKRCIFIDSFLRFCGTIGENVRCSLIWSKWVKDARRPEKAKSFALGTKDGKWTIESQRDINNDISMSRMSVKEKETRNELAWNKLTNKRPEENQSLFD